MWDNYFSGDNIFDMHDKLSKGIPAQYLHKKQIYAGNSTTKHSYYNGTIVAIKIIEDLETHIKNKK
eukprot:6865027-Ditylum_brightwellii.AAC.1